MTKQPPPPEDWEVTDVIKVIDGDTADLSVRRHIGKLDQFTIEAVGTIRVRLVHLDTPERGDPRYSEAADDLGDWLYDYVRLDAPGTWLRVTTQGKDSFGRYLGDVYVANERAETATEHMLRQLWPVWVG